MKSTMKSTMNALVGGEVGGYVLADINIPVPGPGTILCRVHSVALNPYDALAPEHTTTPGAVGGCDFAGTVVEVGLGVSRFKAGDRILAFTTGLNQSKKSAGAFAEFALASESVSCRIPDSLAFTEACSMGVGIAAAGLALFQSPGLQLAIPQLGLGEPTPAIVLVSGGATATGTIATQLLKIAGYTPIVTCSPENSALCESYGASACFDYNSPACGADIRAHTNNSLAHVLDCVSNNETMSMCYKGIGSSGGTYAALKPVITAVKYTRRDVRADWVMAETLLGPAQHTDTTVGRPSSEEQRIFGRNLFALVEQLLQEKKIKSHPLEIRQGGLANIPSGIEDIRAGHVRAKKLVVPITV